METIQTILVLVALVVYAVLFWTVLKMKTYKKKNKDGSEQDAPLGKKQRIANLAIITVLLFIFIGVVAPNSESSQIASNNSLAALNKGDYTDKEGLVVFKDLTSKGYSVTAKYENEKVPAANEDFTEQFSAADVNKCEERLSYDAYVVSDLTQNGKDVDLKLANEPNTNQECEDAPKSEPKKEAAVSREYISALAQANSYANTMHMSKKGVYDQLISEYGGQFKPEAAQYGIDNVKADWNANALAQAKQYQNTMNMSPAAVHDQLISPHGGQFTEAEADYAMEHLND